MIHTAKLPAITLQRLKEIVYLQITLLKWASTEEELSEENCREWLQQRKRFRSHAEKITQWVWQAEKTRRDPLVEYAKGPATEKGTWSKALCHEALLLFQKSHGSIEITPQNEAWQKAGTQFLQHFYNDFRKSGFPRCLFSAADGRSFAGQDFLKAFLSENKHLCVCPACDESQFFTYGRNTIRSEIDHYFPKSLYPHLSCHPFNLVPLCNLCNARLKGNRDPLKGPNGRRKLEDIWLPYRDSGLFCQTYLETTLTSPIGCTIFQRISGRSGTNLRDKIEALGELFDLPSRWDKKKHEVGEKLFRRMRNYFSAYYTSSSKNMVYEIIAQLDELLFIFHEEELAKEPFVYPMIWLLAKLINEELRINELEEPEQTPLLREISAWLETKRQNAYQWQAEGRKIRGVLP